MKEILRSENRGLIFTAVVVALLVAVVALMPRTQKTQAISSEPFNHTGKDGVTRSHDPNLPNYDIRTDKNEEVVDALVKFRQASGKDASAIVSVRNGFIAGEEALRQRVPSLKIEYNDDIRIPEVISPDVKQGRNFLTGSSDVKRSEILRNFVKENNNLIGVNDEQANQLKVAADYTNPDGNLSFAHLEQRINGVPVFRGEVKAGFTKRGEMVRVINNLAPDLDYDSLSKDFYDPLDAVKSAARHINYELTTPDVTRNDAVSTNLKVVFGQGDWATTAEKMYFPTEPGVARTAWRVLIWQRVNAYYVIVDGETGKMLWRKNITEDQTQSATYNVYRNSNAMIDVADSPNPLTPGPVDPTLGTQGPRISRTLMTRIGNEAPYTFNNNGWITDGGNMTDGNAVEAGLDRDTTNGVDATSIPVGSPNRTFDFPFNPGNPVDNTGDTPSPNAPTPCVAAPPAYTDYQKAVATQMFWVVNWYHDELYRLGFTETSFNFQQDNFGRGGTGADRVSAEGQDCSGTNNANFATPADGGRGRMQMFLWTGPTPDFDGTIDADVIIHELTHGTSNRLHGNSAGLSDNMARGMGEGWSDFYAHSLLSEPTDPINGIYTTGGYATYLATAGFTGNYYYGIRRFPKAVLAFTGGPMNKPHNPYTFRYVNADCNTLIGTTTSNPPPNSAYPRGPFGVTTCDQVHNLGEVWSTALWEARALFITRLGHTTGNRKMLQLVTDGMKLAPLSPSFLQERDAIIAAAQASALAPQAAADVADMWNGFRTRGMGFGASIQNEGTGANNTVVTENFDPPNAIMTNPFSVSDSTGDNDGFPEPGESLLLSIAVTNNTGSTVNSVQVSVAGGGMVNYGNIANGATVANNVPYTVPGGATCGSMHQVSITVSSAVGTNQPQTREFRLGAPVGGAPVTFTNNTLINIPNGQPGTTSGPAAPYPSDIVVSGLTGNKLVKVEITGITHTFPGDLDFLLVGPGGMTKYIGLSDSGGSGDVSNLTFTLSDAAAAQPSTTQWVAGDFKPYNSGANDAFVAPAPAAPYTNAAPGGTDTLTSVFGTNGANLNGTWSLYIVDDAGGDFGTMAGWKLTFEANDYACALNTCTINRRNDYDGDGKTDISIFRPSNGQWWIQNSSSSSTIVHTFGTSTDMPVRGDFDGDGKNDVAFWRPSNGTWFVLRSSNLSFFAGPFGATGDIPVANDYDGDSKADFAVFRPSNNTWYILRSSDSGVQIVPFGTTGDIPTPADYDGDCKADIAIFRPVGGTGGGEWWVLRSTAGLFAVPFGSATDMPAPADYTGDGKADIAFWRPSNGNWFVLRSEDLTFFAGPFGLTGDIPVQGNYDGDNKADFAVYRPSINTWYILRSSDSGVTGQVFGAAGDIPTPSASIP
jgi:subtilisin-like proprotein convertase family protein